MSRMIYRVLFIVSVFLVFWSGVSNANMEIDVNKALIYKSHVINFSAAIKDNSVQITDLNYYNKNVSILVGRHSLKIGPGYYSNLMLSDSYPLDMVYYEGSHNIFKIPVSSQMLVAFIDPSINKQLLMHRISNDSLISGLEIGVSEALMAHKMIDPLYYLPIPFWPFYLTTKLRGMFSDYNYYEDKYIGIDFTYNYLKDGKLYGELLVDEYPQHPSYHSPLKRAQLFGLEHLIREGLTFRAEYSSVYNYVYVHRFAENVYTTQGHPIGHWLGPDSEVTDIEFEQQLLGNNTVAIGVRYVRKGIGNFDEDYGKDYWEKRFMYEVTRRDILLRLSYKKDFKPVIINIQSEIGNTYSKTGEAKPVYNVKLELSINL